MVIFFKTHHQLPNSVSLIYKWSMSNLPSHGQPLHHLQLQKEDICICKRHAEFAYSEARAEQSSVFRGYIQTNIDAYGLCVQSDRCYIADISTIGQNGTENHDLRCFVSDCRSMAGTG